MAFDILNNHESLQDLNKNTPLVRKASAIMRQQHNMVASKPSDEHILQLINNNDFVSLKSIIKQYPEFYNKEIFLSKKSYIKGNKNNQIKTKTILLPWRLKVNSYHAAYFTSFFLKKFLILNSLN